MIYTKSEYIHTNGDLKCPICTAHILPSIFLEEEESTTKIECGKCMNEFRIKVKIMEWKDK